MKREVNVNVDAEVAKLAQDVLSDYDLTVDEAVNRFLRLIVSEGSCPAAIVINRERSVKDETPHITKRNKDGYVLLPADWDNPMDDAYERI